MGSCQADLGTNRKHHQDSKHVSVFGCMQHVLVGMFLVWCDPVSLVDYGVTLWSFRAVAVVGFK